MKTTPTVPQLAAPMSKADIADWTKWCIEKKYDGHRMMIVVELDKTVHAYARPRGDGRMIERELAPHIIAELKQLAPGEYDGELLAGDTGTDVTRKDLADQRTMVIFDFLRDFKAGVNVMAYPQIERRNVLAHIFDLLGDKVGRAVKLAECHPLKTKSDVEKFVNRVWREDGEGAILKNINARYWPGKRDAGVWVKIKRVTSAALTVTGFEPTKGTVMNRGTFAKVTLRDKEGNETSAKTRNDYELEQFRKQDKGYDYATTGKHPAIGRLLRIEFARRTRDGGYQGPVRWDRWEDE